MFAAYKRTINCEQSQEVLKIIMEDAVDQYLSLHCTVFPIKRRSLSIVLKVQKNYRSKGELVTVSIKNNSFCIASKCIEEPSQLIAWGKNRDNVLALSDCIKNAIQELSYSSYNAA